MSSTARNLFLIFLGIPFFAFAQEPQDGSFMGQMVILGIFFSVFYFMIIRPQNKKAKEHADIIASVQKGNEVVTNAGFYGKVVDIKEEFFIVEIASGVEVRIQRSSIVRVMPKGTIKSM